MLAGAADLLDLLAGLGRERPVHLGHQDVGEPEDCVERTAQLVADGREKRRSVAVGGPDAHQVPLVARLRGGEARDERVEGDRERADLVHGADGDGFAGRLRANVHHAAHALAHELDVAVGVRRDGVSDGGGHDDEQGRQRDQRAHERRGRFGRAGLAHERDQDLRRRQPSRDERLGAEASTPEPGHRLPGGDRDDTLEGGAVGHAEARVEDHVPFPRDDDELGAGLARRELHEVEPLARRESREARAQRRREEIRSRRRVVIARGGEVRDAERADRHRDGETHEDHDRRREGPERPGAAAPRRRDRCSDTRCGKRRRRWR